MTVCIDYRKLNSWIKTAHQIKANGSLGKVISNNPVLVIDSILAHFNDCEFFSTIDLRSGYYHICLTKEATEKTAFLTDKIKWIFHLLPFGINIGPSACFYVLGKVLAQCTEFALNYLDDIMIVSKMWQNYLKHLEEVFKHLQDADLKIKYSKCKFLFACDSQLEGDDVLPLATYCYNIAPTVDDLESPFYIVHGRDPLEGRLSNLQNY